MREGTPSRTAQWVALARGLADRLPPEGQLAKDPYGAAFEEGPRPRLQRAIERTGIRVERFRAIKSWILYMQVRTRVIDDALRKFVARGGRQVVLLGAGYDTRALRLPELADARVFEVDHPATQGHKRDVLERLGAKSPSTYIAWNFEAQPPSEPGREAATSQRRAAQPPSEPGREAATSQRRAAQPMTELPRTLAEAGHDPKAVTFTIWEGVTMYLTEVAIDTSLRAIRAWSAPGSELAMTYFARTRITEPSLATRVISAVVARVGEPWKWGWVPSELPRYLADRGFAVARDVAMSDAARELLPSDLAALVSNPDQRISFSSSHESIALATSP